GLREKGLLGVTVEGDPPELECSPDVVDVVGGGRGPLRVEARPKLPGALRERDPLGRPAALQVGTVEGSGAPGAAHVDGDQLAAAKQRTEGVDVGARRPRAGIAGAALDGDDRPLGGAVALVTGAHREPDPGLAERGVRA